jgi:hypothetical protein
MELNRYVWKEKEYHGRDCPSVFIHMRKSILSKIINQYLYKQYM